MDVSELQKLGELEYLKNGTTIEQRYPELDGGVAAQYLFKTDENFTLFVCINFEAERLYYKIAKSSGEFVVRFNTLIENVNLLNGVIDGYILVFQNNAFYFGELTE